ncbi:Blue-light-activated histidine kinase 1 [Tsuneonella dongtanensis]|uniref:histidine kinase n=1 Tax=Tsuneonella dongtanensis TaxID=692370 RepID=A0A1B2AB01_9SPHN|nr:PAS domain-containing protein [Tsuneonella dongtanensis]ANY19258.1 Blue-light-activated histidine kinase 1 [Tsuneonella dongtanensis]
MKLEGNPSGPLGATPSAAFCGEDDRVTVLASYAPDAIEDDPELAGIAAFAAQLTSSPIALVSLVESERQRFLVREGLETRETPRPLSFCAHAMLGDQVMEVCDATQDPRFAENELVTGDMGLRFYAGAPLVSPEGAPLGALCVIDTVPRPEGLTDLQRNGLEVLARAVMRRLETQRTELATNARETESARTMREIADLLPAIIWSADGDGNFDYFNSRWKEITGLDRPKVTDDWRPVVHPEDTDAAFGAWGDSAQTGKPFESEYRLKHADGSWRWTLSRAIPLLGADGTIRRWYGTLTDVDDGHRVSENRDLLAKELSHRIKNIFAVVAGLVSIRARRHKEAKEFATELIDAIRSLGRAHDFVRPVEGVKGDSLRGLLKELMAPYGDDRARVTIGGADCEIGPRAATPLALIFHELATNSAKYGALSVEIGRVEIEIDCGSDAERARISWREHGGPPAPQVPGTEGFGSRLVQMSIEGQLGGTMDRRFEAGGLAVDLSIPLKSIRS